MKKKMLSILLAVALLATMLVMLAACTASTGLDEAETEAETTQELETYTSYDEENEDLNDETDNDNENDNDDVIPIAWTPTSTSGLPSLHIRANGTPFVNRELWIDSTFELAGGGNAAHHFADATGRIRGRGNSTWWDLPGKRPLRFTLTSAQPMLGSANAHRNWILLADHADMSLLRNYITLHIGRQLNGLYWTPSARSVHLYVNGQYQGVYLLTEEREVGPGRARLSAHADPTISEYFLELDWRLFRNGTEGEDFFRINTSRAGYSGSSIANVPNRDSLYEIRWPDATPERMEYARAFIERVSRAIRSRDFAAISAVLDINSMADFMIMQELTRNPDAGFSSWFMQIRGQGDNRRLYMGPLWDFDITYGNWYADRSPYGLFLSGQHYWFQNLMQVRQFRTVLSQRFDTMAHPAITASTNHVRQLATRYQSCFARNFTRHPILGTAVWPNRTPPQMVALNSHAAHVDFLLDFITRRANYMRRAL
ncbi:MAG: CotH kinase family protein [Oscillospiraceae bacterium]|nr:CotH kinase family protein [Oscillospiraceae bacterium]